MGEWVAHQRVPLPTPLAWVPMRLTGLSCSSGQRDEISLSTRLDKLEAALRGRDGGDPPHGLICRRLIYDPSEWEYAEDEAISRMKTDELDRLVAAGKMRASDRERVRFIVRRIVQPPERPDDPLPTT